MIARLAPVRGSRHLDPAGATSELVASAPVTRSILALAALAGLLAFAAYAVTVDRSLPTGDSGDLISAAYVLGVAHPPGYPLYTILAHLAMRVPIGSPALSANLLSALLDAATVSVVAVLIYRLVAKPSAVQTELSTDWQAAAASLVGALLLAFSTTFWAYSLVAEVFPLNNLLAALLLLAGLEWARSPRFGWLGSLGLLFGLGLANQQTIVLLVPALVILFGAGVRQWIRLNPSPAGVSPARVASLLGGAAALCLVGLLPYLYLPLASSAHPPVDWGDPRTLDRFMAVVTRADYGSLSLGPGLTHGSVVDQLVFLTQNLAPGFAYLGAVLAVLGLWAMTRRSLAAGLAVTLAFLVCGPFFLVYANPSYSDPVTHSVIERFYILPALPLALGAGAGAYQVLAWVGRVRLAAARRSLVAGFVAAALLLVPLGSAVAHAPSVDQSHNDIAAHYGEDLLDGLRPGAILLMRGDENYTSVAYAQFVEGYRPDVAAMDVELLKLPSYVDLVRRLHPGVVIPWNAYDGGAHTSLADIVRANLPDRPVYYVGVMAETNWTSGFDELRAGLVRELVPKGSANDPYQLLRDQAASFAALHYPAHAHPDTTWEQVIAEHYGSAAFDLAYAIQSQAQSGGSQAEVPLAEQMYETSIRLLPDSENASAYKNLGLLLDEHNGDPKQIVALWDRFLQLKPNDPDAGAIRQRMQALRGAAP